MLRGTDWLGELWPWREGREGRVGGLLAGVEGWMSGKKDREEVRDGEIDKEMNERKA